MEQAPDRFMAELNLPPIRPLAAYGSIAQSLHTVESLRSARQADARLQACTQALRAWQSRRFRQTYADLMPDPHMGAAAQFFLTELYSDQEYSRRDAQFARIAGTIERIFPQSVVQTATLLAQLHALSETLDACMARVLMASTLADQSLDFAVASSMADYHRAWLRLAALPSYGTARQEQLSATHALGLALERHTQVPGLRLMLKMMRGPASAAGLQDLQRFLESGFDTFGHLGRAGKVQAFLSTVLARESKWIDRMSDAED